MKRHNIVSEQICYNLVTFSLVVTCQLHSILKGLESFHDLKIFERQVDIIQTSAKLCLCLVCSSLQIISSYHIIPAISMCLENIVY